MKKRFVALGLLSLCCLAWFTSETQAWHGPLSPWHRHNRYVTHITCRPYNAFTPICWGNLVCDGCNPNPCGVASGCLPLTLGIPPWAYSYGMGHGIPMGGGDSCGVSDMAPGAINTSRPQSFTPPMPLPTGPGQTMMMPQGVSQANFYPQPYYIPQYYYPNYYQPQAVPYYWNFNR